MSLRRIVATCLIALSTTTLSVAAASTAHATVAPPGCPQVEAVSVRGSGSPQGGGGRFAGPQVADVQQRSAQTVRTHDLVYPATPPGPGYRDSVEMGVAALQERLRTVSGECPTVKFVLVGSSQGAQVVANTLDADPVPAAGRIRAVVLFGDPSFNGSEPFNYGSYDRNRDGVIHRPDGALDRFAGRLRSYCNVDDVYCQDLDEGDGHGQYAQYRQNATDFILGKIGG